MNKIYDIQADIEENKNRKLIVTLWLSEKEKELFLLNNGTMPRGVVSKVVIKTTGDNI